MFEHTDPRTQTRIEEARRLRTRVAAWEREAATRASTDPVQQRDAEDATITLIGALITHRYELAETVDLLNVDGRMEVLQIHDCAYEPLIDVEPARPGQLDDDTWWTLLRRLVHALPTSHPRYLEWRVDEPYTGAPLIQVPEFPRPVMLDLTVP